MAQSSARSTQRKAPAGKRSASSSGSRSRGRTRSSSGNGAAGSAAKARSSVRETVATGAQGARDAASKAKGPALTGGAALAGLVGGMAIATRTGRRRVLGVPVPGTRRPLVKIKAPGRNNVTKDLVKAAGQMGTAGRQMAELATEVRLARQQLDSTRRRSPVEVVLEGLTARKGRAG
jgi:hypothetical protein